MTYCLECLPDVVTRTLLKYLDIRSKLCLRGTCRSIRDWVSTKDFLMKFKVQIETEEDLISWIEKCEEEEGSTYSWNNFHIQNQFIGSHFLTTFFSIYQFQLSKIHLHEARIADEIFQQLIESLENLEVLIIDHLFVQSQEGSINGKGPKIPLLKINNLQELSVEQLLFTDPEDLNAWREMIQSMVKLSAIMVPKLLYEGKNISWGDVKTLQWTSIVDPLLNTLTQFPKGRRIILNVKHLVPSHFEQLTLRGKDLELFYCGVHPNHVKSVFLNPGDDEYLRRILSIMEKIDDRKDLRKWTSLEDLYIHTGRCDVRNYYYDEPPHSSLIFPNLRKIRVQFNSKLKDDPGLVGLHRVISLLFKVKRHSVQELTLQWPQTKHDVSTNVVDLYEIRDNFPNLRKLLVIVNGERRRIV